MPIITEKQWFIAMVSIINDPMGVITKFQNSDNTRLSLRVDLVSGKKFEWLVDIDWALTL